MIKKCCKQNDKYKINDKNINLINLVKDLFYIMFSIIYNVRVGDSCQAWVTLFLNFFIKYFILITLFLLNFVLEIIQCCEVLS